MTKEDFLIFTINSEFKNKFTDVEKELSWLTPKECKIYSRIYPSYQDIEVPITSKNYGIGGGIDLLQFMITYLDNPGIIITLIGAITTVIVKLIEKDKDCEISIQNGDRIFTYKGPTKLNKEEIFTKLFPELTSKNIEPAPSELEEFDSEATLSSTY